MPILKIAAMAMLVVTAQRKSRWRQAERASLYRLIETVGHWSMLDVFVVVLLVGMVRFGAFASIDPGAGLLAFGAVVVMTMLASSSFDPRLIWPESIPMSDHETAPSPDLPQPTVVRVKRTRLSLVWLVPIVALVIGAVLVARTLMQAGPRSRSPSAMPRSGVRQDRGARYKEVVIGKVTRVGLSPDRERVLVSVKLDKAVANLAVTDTRFWVVRPRIGLAGVSGLGTLFSEPTSASTPGSSTSRSPHFTGLESPPFLLRGEPGRTFELTARDLGSLDIGSPVYYRRTPVGRVAGYSLDPARDTLAVQIVIDPPNDRLVTPQTRFFTASGIDLSSRPTDSRWTPSPWSRCSSVAWPSSILRMRRRRQRRPRRIPVRSVPEPQDRARASRRAPLRVRMVFDRRSAGSRPGPPGGHARRGCRCGAQRRAARPGQAAASAWRCSPTSIRCAWATCAASSKPPPGAPGSVDAQFVKRGIDTGLRAQVRTGNLLTGQLCRARLRPQWRRKCQRRRSRRPARDPDRPRDARRPAAATCRHRRAWAR